MEADTQDIIKKKDQKIRRQYDNNMFLTLLLLLMPLAIYTACLYAEPDTRNICAGNGQAWKCANCRTYNWQASNNKDWAGNYHCQSCGAKK